MDPPHFKYLSMCLGIEEVIPVSIDIDPEIYLFYGPKWIPVLCYVLKFLYSSDDEENDATLKKTMGLLEDSARKKWNFLPKAILQDFLPHLQKFFVVPAKMPSEQQLNQNEKLAGFLNFILQVWNAEAKRFGDMEGEEDEISKMPGLVLKNQRYSFLHKELKFLLTYLGDVPFQCCTTHQDLLDTLLAELEILANQVGHFTLFFILASRSDRLTEFSAGLDTLMHKVELLNEKIKTYCIKFSELIPAPVPISRRVTRPIDSLFIIDSLLEDLESLINRRFHVTINVDMDEQIETLYEELKLSRIFLKDAELIRQETYSDWLNECVIVIRETAYEAEFLITSYIVKNIPTWYLRLRLPAVIHVLKLKRSRLHEIKSSADEVLQITKDFTGKSSLQLVKTGSTVVEDHLVGVEKSKNEILAHLTGNQNQKALKSISVFGMPGLGKTTLAKYLFGSSLVGNHFDRRAWCVISQIYERRKVLIDILMSISKDENQVSLMAMDDEKLGLKIYKSLYKRRYLIIFDDIWSSSTWDEIKNYFPDDSNGSRIMFTSRNKDAAPKESIFYTVPLLSVDECLDLLLQKVSVNKSCPPCLLDIGKRIAKECGGLPLAVVAIAGILANLDKEESAWEKVEKDLGALILNEHEGCMKVLDYSYEHLPDHLKLCYIYLGTFPEDANIPVKEIKRLWIAEGFIQKEDKKTPENVADEYLHDLINRSLLLIAERKFDGGTKSCGIHDLLRDMCLRKIDGENFMKSTKEPFSLYTRHHRLRIDRTSSFLSSHFGLHCRSFFGHLSAGSPCFPQMPLHRVIHDLSPRLTMWNVLEGIDMLVHLRYLCSRNRELSPPSARYLVNLEVLDVERCSYSKIAFSFILKMRKLKHLIFRAGNTQIINNCDSCPITDLQSLSGITISTPGDEKILKYSPHLRSLKFECYLSKIPDIGSLSKLETLRMTFRYGGRINLATANFPSAIKKLTLWCISGLSWDAISIIGRMLNLQVLKLWYNTFMGEQWETRDGEFQKLKFLELKGFTDFKHWITCSEHFPELQCLVLRDCSELQNVPNDLGYIPTLQLIEVTGCIDKLCESVVQIEAEQHEMGNEELEVKIVNGYCS